MSMVCSDFLKTQRANIEDDLIETLRMVHLTPFVNKFNMSSSPTPMANSLNNHQSLLNRCEQLEKEVDELKREQRDLKRKFENLNNKKKIVIK
jgi:inhibitor of KinA sporulation pathway (predicted exonuclease)